MKELKKKLNTLIELLQEEPIYAIASAIRGPDNFFANNLKWLFTARIRYYLKLNEHFITVRRHKQVGRLDVEKAIEEALRWDGAHHYLQHVTVALYYLRILHHEDENVEKELFTLQEAALRLRCAIISRDTMTEEDVEELKKKVFEILGEGGIIFA